MNTTLIAFEAAINMCFYQKQTTKEDGMFYYYGYSLNEGRYENPSNSEIFSFAKFGVLALECWDLIIGGFNNCSIS